MNTIEKDPVNEFYRLTAALKPAINRAWGGKQGRVDLELGAGVRGIVEEIEGHVYIRDVGIGVPDYSGNFEAAFTGFIVPAYPGEFRRFGFTTCSIPSGFAERREIPPLEGSLTWTPPHLQLSELDVLSEACNRLGISRASSF